MSDMSLSIKAFVLQHLAANVALVGLVPADRIFSMQPPSMPILPFIRYGYPLVEPFEDSCGVGSTVAITLHVFSSDEDNMHRICASIVEALDVVSPSFRLVSCDWDRTNVVQFDQDTWQGAVQFTLVATT